MDAESFSTALDAEYYEETTWNFFNAVIKSCPALTTLVFGDGTAPDLALPTLPTSLQTMSLMRSPESDVAFVTQAIQTLPGLKHLYLGQLGAGDEAEGLRTQCGERRIVLSEDRVCGGLSWDAHCDDQMEVLKIGRAHV